MSKVRQSRILFLIFFDGFDKDEHMVTLYKTSFLEADFGEFYGLEEKEYKKVTK